VARARPRGAAGAGVGLLFTSRTPPPEPLEPYPLGALPPEASSALLRGQAGGELPAEAADWIYRRAQGNPLFTLEYFRHLSRLGYLWSDGKRWRWRSPEGEPMPTSIEALIVQLTRGHGLSPAAEAALAARSMLPSGSSPELWAQAAGLEVEELLRAEEGLERRGLLAGGEFVHPLFAEVVRRELLPQQRQAIAQWALEALAGPNPQAAASFVEEAGLAADEALKLLERAAQAAKQEGNERQAAEFLAQAAQHAAGARRAELAFEAAQRLQDFDPNQAARLGELALQADPQHLEALFLQAELLSRLGRGEEAERLLHGLPEERRPPQRWPQALLQARISRYDFAGALEVWERSPHLQATASTASQVSVGRALIQLGRFAEAKAFLQGAMQGKSPADRAWLQMTQALIPLNEGDFAQAVDSLDQALELIGEARPDRALEARRAEALRYRAVACYRWGRFAQALADQQAYLRYVGEQGDGRRYAEGQANLGLCLIELIRYEQAEETLLDSREVLERAHDLPWLTVVGQGFIRLYLEWAPPHGGALALKHAQAAERSARLCGSPLTLAETLPFVAWAEAIHGQAPRSLELLDESERLSQKLGEERIRVFGRWVRGLALERLGRLEEALEALSEAVAGMRALGHEPFAHRLALEIDRIRGDRKAAERRIQRFEQAQNPHWVKLARRYFPPAGTLAEPPPPGIELEVLGPVRLWVEGSPVEYGARKGWELLGVLLEARLAGRSEVTKLDLIDTLYPEMDEGKAAAALKQLVYRLRSALGSAVITRTSQGYALGAVASDAEQFLQRGDTRLWRGPYLQGVSGGWDASVRESLYHALRTQASRLLPNAPEEALRIGRLLLEADPYDLEGLTLGVRALQHMNNPAGAERLYRQAREHFAEVGERLPEDWQQFLLTPA
jgi:tetratricopeptide (TPR) repeat protein